MLGRECERLSWARLCVGARREKARVGQMPTDARLRLRLRGSGSGSCALSEDVPWFARPSPKTYCQSKMTPAALLRTWIARRNMHCMHTVCTVSNYIYCCVCRCVCTHHLACDWPFQAAGISRAVACSTAGAGQRRHDGKQSNSFVRRTTPASACSPFGLILRPSSTPPPKPCSQLFSLQAWVRTYVRLAHLVPNLWTCIIAKMPFFLSSGRIDNSKKPCSTDVSLKSTTPTLPFAPVAHDVMCLSRGTGPVLR